MTSVFLETRVHTMETKACMNCKGTTHSSLFLSTSMYSHSTQLSLTPPHKSTTVLSLSDFTKVAATSYQSATIADTHA